MYGRNHIKTLQLIRFFLDYNVVLIFLDQSFLDFFGFNINKVKYFLDYKWFDEEDKISGEGGKTKTNGLVVID